MMAMATRISAAAILIGALATGVNAKILMVAGGGGGGPGGSPGGGPGLPLASGSGPGGGGGGLGGLNGGAPIRIAAADILVAIAIMWVPPL